MNKKKSVKKVFIVFLLILVIFVMFIVGYFLNKLYSNKGNIGEEIPNLENSVSEIGELKTNKEKSSNPPDIVLYYGLDIKTEDLELSIPYTKENMEKYEITYYNYEKGEYLGETTGKLEETYEGVSQVSNTKKIAISEKYDAIPRKYKTIENIPSELEELSKYDKLEIQSIDLDGDNTLEYIVACSTYSKNTTSSTNYTNYSEILIYNNEFKKIATLVKAENQFWEPEGEITSEFFCSLNDVEYIDIDNDGIMEIIVDKNVYEGVGINIYKYQDGKITGDIDCTISVLP